MAIEPNSEIIRQLYLDISCKIRQNIDYKVSSRKFSPYSVSARPSSLKAFNTFFASVNQAFPDFKLTVDSLISKGDRVMARYTILGTHKGDFWGLGPTYKLTTITGIDIFRLEKGKVVEHWDAAHQINARSPSNWSQMKTPRDVSPIGAC